jgi:hypothetical protein
MKAKVVFEALDSVVSSLSEGTKVSTTTTHSSTTSFSLETTTLLTVLVFVQSLDFDSWRLPIYLAAERKCRVSKQGPRVRLHAEVRSSFESLGLLYIEIRKVVPII